MGRLFLIFFTFLLISGCALFKDPLPEKIYLEPAEQEQKPPGEIAVPIPYAVPMPNQMKPIHPITTKTKKTTHKTALKTVNKAGIDARQYPVKDGFVNSMAVYDFMPGALYQIYSSPGHVTNLILQPGEKIISKAAGDTRRWKVGETISGSGTLAQPHIVIKPTYPNIKTNIFITTDRRSYHADLISTKEAYMSSVSWNYPHDNFIAVKTQINQKNSPFSEPETKNTTAKAETNTEFFNPSNLNFNYFMSGDEPPWLPIRAFDDSQKTFIQFPEKLQTYGAPVLFVKSPDDQLQLVNYRIRDSYYIVDRLFQYAELRMGNKDPTVVVIENKEYDYVDNFGKRLLRTVIPN